MPPEYDVYERVPRGRKFIEVNYIIVAPDEDDALRRAMLVLEREAADLKIKRRKP